MRPVAGSLTFRQITETPRWRLTKTWISDPQGDSVLADVRFVSRTGRPLALYALADPAPGDDGNDDLARRLGDGLLAHDDTVGQPDRGPPGAWQAVKRLRRDGQRSVA